MNAKWIPVGERLPKPCTAVWAYDQDTRNVVVGWLSVLGHWFDVYGSVFSVERIDESGMDRNVTHWQPLEWPEPPE